MADESLLPYLSQFDPAERAEGSIDPLGLYSVADAMGVLLVPGVRERQSTPRYLTVALAGMAAVSDDTRAIAEEKGVPAWLAYEWTVVEALVRQWKGQPQLQGIPGRDKVQTALDKGDVICERTYLKTPTVFGFHGIYRVLGLKLGLFDSDARPLERGYRLLTTWQSEQKLAGFLGGDGPGADFRRNVDWAVRRGIEVGYARDPGTSARQMLAEHLDPHAPGKAEAAGLWDCIAGQERLRAEYAKALVSDAGSTVWKKTKPADKGASHSESKYHRWLLDSSSPAMQQLLKAIRAYERLSRLLTDGFQEILWILTEVRAPIERRKLAGGAGVKRAAREVRDAFGEATRELGIVDPRLRIRAERSLSWVGEISTAEELATRLIEHHCRVQRAKPPNGKRPWLDVFDDGRVAVRPAYTRANFASTDEYVHAYRTEPLWSFALDLRRVKEDE